MRPRRRPSAGRPPRPEGLDVLVVGVGTTAGLRVADAELVASLRRAGARAEVVWPPPPRGVRTLALSDLAVALGTRRTARRAIAELAPRAIVYSTTTAALLAPAPGAVRFDAVNQGNRPGRHGVWQQPVERRLLRRAPLLLPQSPGALEEARGPHAETLVVPVAVAPSGPPAPERDIAVIAYGANPHKKGLDRVLEAWGRARRPGETLVVAGTRAPVGGDGVRSVGLLDPAAYRALLRRARVYVTAPRREDYGIAQLEALADGCALVTTAGPGPYAALPLARALDPRLVGENLAVALRTALDDPVPGYAERAAELLAPYSSEAVDRVVAEELLPRLLAG